MCVTTSLTPFVLEILADVTMHRQRSATQRSAVDMDIVKVSSVGELGLYAN